MISLPTHMGYQGSNFGGSIISMLLGRGRGVGVLVGPLGEGLVRGQSKGKLFLSWSSLKRYQKK